MTAGPSSSRRNARTRSTERVISVFGRSSTGKPARYIFEPARDNPSGSLTTSTPSALSRRPKSSAGLKASTSTAPALGLLRRKITSKSTRRAASRGEEDAARGRRSGPAVVDEQRVAELLRRLRSLDRVPGPLTGVTEVVVDANSSEQTRIDSQPVAIDTAPIRADSGPASLEDVMYPL